VRRGGRGSVWCDEGGGGRGEALVIFVDPWPIDQLNPNRLLVYNFKIQS